MLDIRLDRNAKASLSQQIHQGMAAAIRDGRLKPGARLPSWRDLASQLGVARGTVRDAYGRLADDMLVTAAGSAGTHVVETAPKDRKVDPSAEAPPLPDIFGNFTDGVRIFQMGVPAQNEFPTTTWSRIIATAAKASALSPARYPDPRGDFELRREIAAYVAIARGISCTPAQVVITNGYGSALSLAVRVLRLVGAIAWIEDPGYPLTRIALGFAGITAIPVAVDGEGLDVELGMRIAEDAALAIVTPGQQAPLGMTMSLKRRLAVLDWADRNNSWIIEDDYLGELQLTGRAAPALAAMDENGRVIHIGTFSKTIGPTIRLGFMIVPPSLAGAFGVGAASTAPAPASVVQLAIAEFLREGHYLRHLRRMKRLYAARRDLLMEHIETSGLDQLATPGAAGATVVLTLRAGTDDKAIAKAAHVQGLSPVALSPWYLSAASSRPGLLLSVTNYDPRSHVPCVTLANILKNFGDEFGRGEH